MSHLPNPFQTLRSMKQGYYYSLPALAEKFPQVKRLPISIRIILESLLRHCDGYRVKEEDVLQLVNWNAKHPHEGDVPFIVSRVLLQDFTGVPLLVDLAAMRDAVAGMGRKANQIEPEVPVDLVIDHSVQVDRARTDDAFAFNVKLEFDRNQERYRFLKWGQQAFKTFSVVPPSIGIVHQVNLENLATVVNLEKRQEDSLLYFDTLVGTDSHTTMINGLGVVGWGVGGIEAEAAMLGQPVSLQTPEVIGFHLKGHLQEGVTATDLTLHITEILRREKVVGKFVEFFGEGTASLTIADRATIGNMSPEQGSTMSFFPFNEKNLEYLEMTGRDPEHIARIKDYLVAQEMFGIPRPGEIHFTKELELDLSAIRPSVSGPRRPQDRVNLPDLQERFLEALKSPVNSGGYDKGEKKDFPRVFLHASGKFTLLPHDMGGTEHLVPIRTKRAWSEEEMVANRPFNKVVVLPGYGETAREEWTLTHGSIVIAAITSCTNTSNPSVMLGAGLLAKKAFEKGLRVNPLIKTSLAPGSRVVTDYLEKTGLQHYLNELGFQLVGYGCTTCIGNSGPLDERVEGAIKEHDLITASVLSGNRNFEARIHSAVKANFLMSPPLVVAFAIAGRVDINLDREPLGYTKEGAPVFLREIWPSQKEIGEAMKAGIEPSMFKERYANVTTENPNWQKLETNRGDQYQWESQSSYIQKPPYFDDFSLHVRPRAPLKQMRALAIFGDSISTDHISPAGAINKDSPAGKYLLSLGVEAAEFNSYGSRRGNHHVMMRGTFANVRIRNKMANGKEGGYTTFMPNKEILSIFEASQRYAQEQVPLIVFAGKDYGMGSSRDWAAKGPALLGVKVVVAQSFERIHRSNLIGMGILPLQFYEGEGTENFELKGEEFFSLKEPENWEPRQNVWLEIQYPDGQKKEVSLISRLDTPLEAEYYRQGGILPFVLRNLLTEKNMEV